MAIYNTAPTHMDLFSRIMAEKFHAKNKVRKNMGFLSFFGNEANGGESRFTNDALSVDIDIVKDNTVISALTTRGANPTLNQKQTQGAKASTTSRVFPISSETGAITAVETYHRQMGEMPYQPKSQYERYREIAASIFDDKIRAQMWLFEQLASESILEGTMKTDEFGNGFDFKRDADNKVNAATPWTDSASKPLEDIDSLCTLVDRNGYAEPDFVGMDKASYTAFINHASVKEMADNRRYNIVMVGDNSTVKPESKYDRHIKAGWSPRAYLTTDGGYSVWIFTYNSWYRNASEVKTDFIPKGTVFAISSEARFDRYFGPSDKLPSVLSTSSVLEQTFGIESAFVDAFENGGSSIIDPRQFHFYAFNNGNDSAINLEVQTAPIYACTQVDAVATMKLTVV